MRRFTTVSASAVKQCTTETPGMAAIYHVRPEAGQPRLVEQFGDDGTGIYEIGGGMTVQQISVHHAGDYTIAWPELAMGQAMAIHVGGESLGIVAVFETGERVDLVGPNVSGVSR